MKTITYNPETHVLVPREPSEDMLQAATADSCWEDMNPPPSVAYRSMLAAAPQPEQVDVGSVGWKHDCAALCANDIELWIDRCPHCGKPRHNHPPTDDEHMPECVTALYTTPQPDRVTTKESYVELDIHSNPSRTEQQRKLDGSLEVGQLLGNGQNQETSHSKTVGDILLADAFRGDAANLIESIVALVSLDRAGVLVPHGIGGHARSLLESAAIRLSQPDRVAELEAALKVAKAALTQFLDPEYNPPEDTGEWRVVLEAISKINEVLK